MESSESRMFVWSYKILENLNSGEQKKWLSPGRRGGGWTHKSLLSLCFCVFISRPLCFVVCYWGWTRLGKICPDPRPESRGGGSWETCRTKKYEEWVWWYYIIKKYNNWKNGHIRPLASKIFEGEWPCEVIKQTVMSYRDCVLWGGGLLCTSGSLICNPQGQSEIIANNTQLELWMYTVWIHVNMFALGYITALSVADVDFVHKFCPY